MAAAGSVPAAARRAFLSTVRRAERAERFRSRRTAAFRIDFRALAELGMLVSAWNLGQTPIRDEFRSLAGERPNSNSGMRLFGPGPTGLLDRLGWDRHSRSAVDEPSVRPRAEEKGWRAQPAPQDTRKDAEAPDWWRRGTPTPADRQPEMNAGDNLIEAIVILRIAGRKRIPPPPYGSTAAADDRSRKKVNDTPWKGTMP